jgi:enamine deaminase RidA (YjgF/YER057c/UK114 family)
MISTPNAPAAIDPCSLAILAGNTLYLVRQIAIEQTTGALIRGTIEDATTLVLDNLAAVLEVAGMSMPGVVSTTVFCPSSPSSPR